ncbi:gliding motility-associated C-terminal domain-containing protein [Ilyomonas limi]|uniref:Gliding motility-associated C-terminal domain-containing protein n=1 Tax=Ilyomonas limi TaxID=2575867 RepID=A0A4U3L303_9BACT|nr:gliding motility-associated C-terminal domain-containing protein [Ilyomonas limi]TKK69262.1 gliding motility-associated C-terminal domain-containing protein [Ilyomonas limi]
MYWQLTNKASLYAIRKYWLFAGIFLFLSFVAKAQLCNNNLGDPIINVTFGTVHAPLPPNATTYDYVGGCPSKGQYTINDFLFGCGGYWVQMTGDHTSGDLNGNYMMVDAESTPGLVHLDTARGLCSGLSYQFAAYITNIMTDGHTCDGHALLPNLTFSVEDFAGNILATYNTGDIPITNEKKWVQYGFVFQTPASVSDVILKITANAQYGCGNAFAIDDITLALCGPAVDVTIDGTKDDQNVCANYTNPFVMKGTYSAGFTDPATQWQNSVDTGKTWQDIPGAITATYTVPHRMSGIILYRMVVAERANINSVNCRIRSNAIYTEIHPVPLHNPPQMIKGCTGKDYSLPASDPRALNIEWNGPNGYHKTAIGSTTVIAIVPDLQYADTGLYTLKQYYDYGCVSFDSFYLQIFPGTALSIQPSHPICEGVSEVLLASAPGNVRFKWTPSTGLSSDTIPNPVAQPNDSTVYKVVITNEFGCQDSALFPVEVYRKPVAMAGADKAIISGDTAVLDAVVKGTAINYYWLPSDAMDDSHAIQPKVYPSQNKVYSLQVTSTVGCGNAVDEVMVKVYADLFIPTAFTPNGDGTNDRFRILPLDNYNIVRFLVYNRWGSIVYKATDFDKGWDGNYNGLPQQAGAYIYHLELQNNAGRKVVKEGTVFLLR